MSELVRKLDKVGHIRMEELNQKKLTVEQEKEKIEAKLREVRVPDVPCGKEFAFFA